MNNHEQRPDIEAVLKDPDNHFMDWRRLDDGTYIALARLAFTVGLFVGVGPITPYKRRYCFDNLNDAATAFIDMETGDDVPTGWIARRPELPEDIEAKSKPNYDPSQFWPKEKQ
jgi:hypothetical protein